MKKRLLLALLVISSLTVFAQQKKVSYTNQQWFQYYGRFMVSEQWSLLADGGFRFQDGFGKKSQYIVRAGLGYQWTPTISVATGFAHLGFYGEEKLNRVEYRPYQELASRQTVGKIRLAHRFRIEERYFRTVNQERSTDEDLFFFRFRYNFQLGIPLFPVSSRLPDKKLTLNLGDEIFFNAGREIVYNVFDQNRILVGLEVPVLDNLSISLTYNHQFVSLPAPTSYRQDYIFWMGIRHSVDIRKKERNQ